MSVRGKVGAVSAVSLTVLLVTGCGGSGDRTNRDGPQVRRTGTISVAVKFPEPQAGQAVPADLPNATKSVALLVYDPASPGDKPLVPPVVIQRQSGQSAVQGTIQNVPAGEVLLRVKAFDVDNPDVVPGQVQPSSRSFIRRAEALAAGNRRTPSASVAQASEHVIAEAETIVTVVAGQTTRVTVTTSRRATEVRISGPTELYVGQTATYIATAYDADGNVILGTLTATFSSSNPSVLAVAPDGQAQALELGTATVGCDAKWNNRVDLSSAQDVTVGLPPSARLVVTATPHDPSAPNHILLEPGNTATLYAELVYGTGPPGPPLFSMTWTSSDPNVARVDSDGGNAATVQGNSAGVVTITGTFGETLSCTAEVVVMPKDSQILHALSNAQKANGAFADKPASTEYLNLAMYGDVAVAMRVLGGMPRDPQALANYMESLYDPATCLYRDDPSTQPLPIATAGALRAYLSLHSVLPNFPHPEAVRALMDYVVGESVPYVGTTVGRHVTALCGLLGPDWPDGKAEIVRQGLSASRRADGSYHLGQTQDTCWAVIALRALGGTVADPSATADFIRSTQTSGGWFSEVPGTHQALMNSQPIAVAALYALGSDVPNPWAMKCLLAGSWYPWSSHPQRLTRMHAQFAITKKLLERDPLAIKLWVEHKYD